MLKIEQLHNKSGESIYPIIHKSQIAHKADSIIIGDIHALETEVKESLVLAINENAKKITYNLQQLGLKVTKEDVEKMLSLSMADVIKKGELEELIKASAVIIAINDKLSEIKTTKADKSDIPTKIGELSNDVGFITLTEVAESDVIKKLQVDLIDAVEDIAGMTTKAELEVVKNLIPTKVGELENDKGYVGREDLSYVQMQERVGKLLEDIKLLASKESLEQIKEDIPTKVSQLENDSKYITIDEVPTGSLDEIKTDIEQLKLTKAEQSFVQKEVKRLDDIIEALEIPEGTDVRPLMKAIEELKEGKADKNEIPQKISQLENDLNYITEDKFGEISEIVSILNNISSLVERVSKTEASIAQTGVQVEKNKTDIGGVKKDVTQLQSDVGTTDITVGEHSAQLAKLEEGQEFLQLGLTEGQTQISENKEDIASLEAQVKGIPKQTSDLINDSGFVDKQGVLAMDLKENQTIKNIESNKANKTDIPTNVNQLDGVDTLQTKAQATEEHQSIISKLGEKAGRDELPTKFTDLEDDIGLIDEEELNTVKKVADKNTLSIEEIKEAKRVVLSKEEIPTAERLDGNLYLQIKRDTNKIEDHVGRGVFLETNKVAEFDSHQEGQDGTIYVLTSNQKGYILLGGEPKAISLAEDVDEKDKTITEAIKALQTDMGSLSERVSANTEKVVAIESDVSKTKSELLKVSNTVEKHQVVLDGQGRDMVALREKDNTHDSQILSLQTTVKNKANIEDIPTKVSELTNDKGFITAGDIPEVDLSGLQEQIEEKAPKLHKHNTDDVTDPTTGKTQTTINTTVKSGIESLDGDVSQLKSDVDDIQTLSLKTIENNITNLKLEKADKTDIPTKVSTLENDSGFITVADVDLSGVQADINTLKEQKADKGHSHGIGDVEGLQVALEDKASTDSVVAVDKKVQALSDAKANKEHTHSEYAKQTDVPSKTSQLLNDSKFITLADIPEVDLGSVNEQITALKTGKVDKEEGKGLSSNDFTSQHKENIASNKKGIAENKTQITTLETTKADKSEIPTNVSELINDAGYITDTKEVDSKILEIQSSLEKHGIRLDSIDGELVVVKNNIEKMASKEELTAGLDGKYDKSDTYSKKEVNQRIAQIIGNAPENLDTLEKLAQALDNDSSFASSVTKQLTDKVDKEAGKGLSSNDFTGAYKSKLDSVEQGATKTTKVGQLENDKKYITLAEVPKVDLTPYLKKDGSDTEFTLGKGAQFESNFKSDNWSFINNYTGGGWARGLLNIRNKEGENCFQIGGNGGGQNFTRLYMGKAWDDWNLSINPNSNLVEVKGRFTVNNKELAELEQLTKLQKTVENKADIGHKHNISDVTSLQATLDSLESKIESSGGAVTSVNDKTGNVVLSAEDIMSEVAGGSVESGLDTMGEALSALYLYKADKDHTHSEYVSKTGDSMTGTLNVKTPGFPVARFERETTATGNRYGAINLVRSGAIPVDGVGIGFYFKNNNKAGAETHSGFFGGALDSVDTGNEVGQLVFAPAYKGQDPYSRTDFTLTALNHSESVANFRGELKVNNKNVSLKYTQKTEPTGMNVGDEWHKIRD